MTDNMISEQMSDPERVLATIEDMIAVGRPRLDLRMSDSVREDIGLDSLSLMEALTRVEDEYDIALIDNDEIFQVVTVGDLVGLVQRTYDARHGIGQAAPVAHRVEG